MLITIKVTALAYNLLDGTTNRRHYEKERKYGKSPGTRKEAETRLKLCLEQLPDLVEYFAWIYHYAFYVYGPAFELRHYQDALRGNVYKVDNEKDSSVFWSSVRACLLKLLQACFVLAFSEVIGSFVPFNREISPGRLQETSFVQTINRAFWLYISVMASVCMKHHFVWKLTESAANLAGFGFNPSEERKRSGEFTTQDWNAVSQVDVTGFHTGSSIQKLGHSWNKRTQWWIEHYIYRRVPRCRGLNIPFTFFVVAFWHGFYGTHYLLFFTLPLFSVLDKRLRPVFNPLFYVDNEGNPSVSGTVRAGSVWKVLERVYHVFCVVVATTSILYAILIYAVPDCEKGMAIWGSLYFAPHFCAFLLHLVVSVLPAHKRKIKSA